MICLIAHGIPAAATFVSILAAHQRRFETDVASQLSLGIFTIMQSMAIGNNFGIFCLVWWPTSLLRVINKTCYFYEIEYIQNCKRKVGLFFFLLVIAGIYNAFNEGNPMEHEIWSIKFIWTLLILYGFPCSYVASCGVIFVVGISFNSVRIDFCSKMLQSTNTMNFSQGLDHCLELKSFVEECNKVFGSRFLLYSIVTVIYYAYIPELLAANKWSSFSTIAAFMSTGTIMWLSLAEFHKSVCMHFINNFYSDAGILNNVLVALY